MNAFQTCKNTADAVPLYLPLQLFLKPVAKLTISIQLPNVKKLNVSISHWEIMEKLREFIKPEDFSILKVSKTTVEFVRFDAELEDKSKLEKVISKLNNRTLKLKDIPDLLRIRSAMAKSLFPSRHVWDSYFQEAKDMNEMKPGERPDTIHISKLPIKWFIPCQSGEDLVPSEKILYKIFEKFGTIRYVDIPKCDPYRNKMKDSISGIKSIAFDDNEFFEGYVQFKDYIGFTKAMDYFRDMKLMHKDEDEALTVTINVDFDRSKHLTDASIRRREIVRDRLVKKQREKEEKEKKELEEKKLTEENERKRQIELKLQKQQRRKIREEKRKAKILDELKIQGADEINEKIAKEEKKLLKVQRKLEAIRLVEELFKRINVKNKDDDGAITFSDKHRYGYNELQEFKNTSELEVLNQRKILHHAIKGRVMLKTILSGSTKVHDYSSSDSDEPVSSTKNLQDVNPNNIHGAVYDPLWYGYPYQPAPMYPPLRGHPAEQMFASGYPPRRRGFYKMPFAGPSRNAGFSYQRRGRGFNPRFRGGYHNKQHYPPELEEEYIKYFSKFLHRDERHARSHSRSRSRSRSRSTSHKRSRSRHGSRSRSRSHSYRSRSRSRSRTRRYNRSRSRNRSCSYSSRSKSRKRHSRSDRSSRSRTPSAKRSSRSKHDTSATRSKDRSRSASVDSSKFISPNRMRNERSKSWSMPRTTDKDRSWSKSPENKSEADKPKP